MDIRFNLVTLLLEEILIPSQINHLEVLDLLKKNHSFVLFIQKKKPGNRPSKSLKPKNLKSDQNIQLSMLVYFMKLN
jgi:hypothetical protein